MPGELVFPKPEEVIRGEKRIAFSDFRNFIPVVYRFWEVHSPVILSQTGQFLKGIPEEQILTDWLNLVTTHPDIQRHKFSLHTLAGPVFEYLNFAYLRVIQRSRNLPFDFYELGTNDSLGGFLDTEEDRLGRQLDEAEYWQFLRSSPMSAFVDIKNVRFIGLSSDGPDGVILQQGEETDDFDDPILLVRGFFETKFGNHTVRTNRIRKFIRTLNLEELGDFLFDGERTLQLSEPLQLVEFVRSDFPQKEEEKGLQYGWRVVRTPFDYYQVTQQTALLLNSYLERS